MRLAQPATVVADGLYLDKFNRGGRPAMPYRLTTLVRSGGSRHRRHMTVLPRT